jgi:digalactosyldiacylglycerol synthase
MMPCNRHSGNLEFITNTTATYTHNVTQTNQQRGFLQVVLVVPFVPIQDQRLIFPEGVTCSTPQQQEAIIKAWAREHSGLQDVDFKVLFYAARYYPASRCIFATEDVCRLLPKEQVS